MPFGCMPRPFFGHSFNVQHQSLLLITYGPLNLLHRRNHVLREFTLVPRYTVQSLQNGVLKGFMAIRDFFVHAQHGTFQLQKFRRRRGPPPPPSAGAKEASFAVTVVSTKVVS